VRFFLTTAFLLYGVGVSVRLGWAELVARPEKPDQMHQALHILGSTPNAACFERLADLESEPREQTQFLQQALQVNPRLTSARIRLGLLQERRNLESAEHTLLEADRYDHQYLPSWTVANYYFRHDNREDFWRWSRAALQLNHDEPRPLLRLASLIEPDDAAVLARFQGGEQIAYVYMDLLIGAGRLDGAQRVARTVLHLKEVRKNQLVDLTTRQLKAGNIAWALEIWNALHFPLDPERGPVLPRPPFETVDGEGFHLRPLSNLGISQDWRGEEAAFSFEGSEPDACPLFEQPIPVPQHSMQYRLRYEYKSSATGVRWRMAGAEFPLLPLEGDWRLAEWNISIPPGQSGDGLRILPLQLLYRREPGTLPGRGQLTLRNLQLTIL